MPSRCVLQDLVEAFLGLAGEDRDAEILRHLDVGRHLVEHGEAAGDVETADRHLHAGRAQGSRDVERPGELVGLHADNPDQAEPAIALDELGDLARADAGVGLVHGDDVDGEVRPEDVPLAGAAREAVDGGERVRRHGRADPLHDIALGVVMRRLDQDQLELFLVSAFGADHPSGPKERRLSRAKGLNELGRARRFTSDWTLYRTVRPLPPTCRMAHGAPLWRFGHDYPSRLNHIPGEAVQSIGGRKWRQSA